MGGVCSAIEDGFTSGCSNLVGNFESLGSSIVSIGSDAFNGIKGIQGDLVLTGLNIINDGVYAGCNYYNATLTFSNSLVSIGNNAFSRSTGLIGALNIPNTVKSIGDGAFRECKGFTSVALGGVVTIGASAFEGCSGFVGTLNIPNTVTRIGNNAFKDCIGLTAVTFGNSIVSIGDNAFSGCVNIVSAVNIPNTIQNIGNSAFYNCVGITSVTLGNVTSIGNDAFNSCKGLSGSVLILPATARSIGERSFAGCVGFAGNLTIPNSVTSIGNYAFSGLEFTGQIILSTNKGFTAIGDGVLISCRCIGDINFPENLKTIGQYALVYAGIDNQIILPITILNISGKLMKRYPIGFSLNITLPIEISYTGAVSIKSPELTAGITVFGQEFVEITVRGEEPYAEAGVAPVDIIGLAIIVLPFIRPELAPLALLDESLIPKVLPTPQGVDLFKMTTKDLLIANNPNLRPYAISATLNTDVTNPEGIVTIGGLATANESQPFGDNGAQDKPLGGG